MYRLPPLALGNCSSLGAVNSGLVLLWMLQVSPTVMPQVLLSFQRRCCLWMSNYERLNYQNPSSEFTKPSLRGWASSDPSLSREDVPKEIVIGLGLEQCQEQSLYTPSF